MNALQKTGILAVIIAIGFGAVGFLGMQRVDEGRAALQGFSEAQDVNLNYDRRTLVDRGTKEGAQEILKLLGDTWNWPINEDELDSKDTLVNTATEYMYQMATIASHTLHGTQNVTLTERVEYDGDGDGDVPFGTTTYTPETWPVFDPEAEDADAVMTEIMNALDGGEDQIFEPGTYQVPVNERYYTHFNRMHPLDGPARSQTWSGTVHGLFAELGVGATTATMLEMAQTMVYIVFAVGAAFLVLGGGMFWFGRRKEDG